MNTYQTYSVEQKQFIAVYQLAYHYIEADDRAALKYAIAAGLKSKEAYAHEEAEKYLQGAVSLLEEKIARGETAYRTLWIECLENIGDIYLTVGKRDQGIHIFLDWVPLVSQRLKRANAYRQLSRAYYKKSDYSACEEYGKKSLTLLGEHMPLKRFPLILSIMKEFVAHLLYHRQPASNRPRKPEQVLENQTIILSPLIIRVLIAHLKRKLLWFKHLRPGRIHLEQPLSITSKRLLCIHEF